MHRLSPVSLRDLHRRAEDHAGGGQPGKEQEIHQVGLPGPLRRDGQANDETDGSHRDQRAQHESQSVRDLTRHATQDVGLAEARFGMSLVCHAVLFCLTRRA